MDNCSKDVINGLPDHLLCQILSNLSTKEAALTSLLSKRWRYVFALVPNLDFDDFSSLHHETEEQDQTSFIDFVDRVLELRGKEPVNKFSLRCGDGIVDEDIYPWILNVLRHGVSDLSLHVSPALVHWLPSKVFASKALVRLKIGPKDGPRIKLRNVCLPKLKILNLDSVVFEEGQIGFAKLLSGCPVLEKLSLLNLAWEYWDSCIVFSKILKRLKLCIEHSAKNPKSVIFDTPNVVYLEYSDNIAHKYPKVNLDSLVKASISIRMTNDQKANMRQVSDGDEETAMVGKVMDLLMGICCVKTLYLSYDTLEILNSCCEAIPVSNNLTHLSIESNPEVGWDSLPDLLKRCPNLETLVFHGLLHKATNRCGDVCLCQGLENSPICLSSSPVKFLKILKFGETDDGDNVEMEIELIKNFWKKMPNLEQLIIHYNTSLEDDLVEVSKHFHMFPARHSLECTIQVVSDKISLSSTLPISSSEIRISTLEAL